MPKVEPGGPRGFPPRENERETYGGERDWATGAGEKWTSKRHTGAYAPGPRETDPESARWYPDAPGRDDPGVVRRFTDELGLTRPGPKGYRRSDERIREDICERLWDEPRIDVGDVSVAVQDGVVTLEGSVPERRMKHVIEDIAAGCRGVEEVENRVHVSRIGAI